MAENTNNLPGRTQFLLYSTEDGKIKIEARLQDENIWLTQIQMAELFQTTQQNISLHILNIYKSGELKENPTHKEFLSVRSEGKREVKRNLDCYNLDIIISVGYRVNSLRGTQFRIWATERLREYIIKGFTMDDERLKSAGGGNYFDEVLARIRDIRSSEKVFWRKVLDIYSTSIDYSPNTEMSRQFFKIMQNKMHWAAHGKTAAEIVFNRANAALPTMGLTSWKSGKIRKEDVPIAKNYLNEKELDVLNRIVTAYLEFAELQATNQVPMFMKDWIAKLDDFLKLSGKKLLEHAGTVSNEQATEKALSEYQKYRNLHLNDLNPIDKHFLARIKEIKQIEKKRQGKK